MCVYLLRTNAAIRVDQLASFLLIQQSNFKKNEEKGGDSRELNKSIVNREMYTRR